MSGDDGDDCQALGDVDDADEDDAGGDEDGPVG